MKHPLSCAVALALSLGSAVAAPLARPQGAAMPSATMPATAANPFFADSPLPLHYPDFAKIKDTDFAPAFDQGMKEDLAEIDAIANNPAAPTFDNTIVAMEKGGRTLTRSTTVFYNLLGADKNDAREKIDEKYSPLFAAHQDEIGLNPEQVHLVERYYTDFVRAGAKLSDADKVKLKDINAQLATLGTQFDQKLIAERNASAVVVDTRAELDGLTDAQIDAA